MRQHRIHAAAYDRMTGPLERAVLSERRARLLTAVGGQVLDIGAGTGANIPYFQQASLVTAAEPDPAMRKRLTAKAAAARVPVEAGCHLNRDIAGAIERAVFIIEKAESFDPYPRWTPARPLLETIAAPRPGRHTGRHQGEPAAARVRGAGLLGPATGHGDRAEHRVAGTDRPARAPRPGGGRPVTTLSGKAALVTGGASGIGAGIARVLAAAGAQVAIGDLDADAAAAVAGELPGAGARLGVRLDVTDRASTDQAVTRVEQEIGPVDVLVNNAGVSSVAPFLDITDRDWDRLMAVNLRGVLVVTQRVLPPMLSRRSGRIINISSMAGKEGLPNLAHYCATKFGVIGLTQSLAREVADRT